MHILGFLHSKKSAAVHEGQAAGTALRSFPDVLYPTVSGATPAEKTAIENTLDSLPLKDATAPDSITVTGHIPGASGVTRGGLFYHPITLARDQMADPGFARGTLIHETGHAIDFQHGVPRSLFGPFGKGPFVQDPSLADPNYAATNRFEDWAQSYKFYRTDPQTLKAANPAKYQAMQQMDRETPLQAAADKPAYRETGKWMADELGKVPFSRPVLAGIAWTVGAFSLIRGADQWHEGRKGGNAWEKLQGQLNVATGALLTSGLAAPLALVFSSALSGLRDGVRRGDVKPADVAALERQKGAPHGDALKPAAVAVESSILGTAGGLLVPLAAVPAAVAVGGPALGAAALILGGIAGFRLGAYAGERIAAKVVGAAKAA